MDTSKEFKTMFNKSQKRINENLIDSGELDIDVKLGVVQQCVVQLRKRYSLPDGMSALDLLHEGVVIALSVKLNPEYKRFQQVAYLQRAVYWSLHNAFFHKYYISRKEVKKISQEQLQDTYSITSHDGREDEEIFIQKEYVKDIWEIGKNLVSENDYICCYEYYQNGVQAVKLAKERNISHQRIQQILKRFILRLRDYLWNDYQCKLQLGKNLGVYAELSESQLEQLKTGEFTYNRTNKKLKV